MRGRDELDFGFERLDEEEAVEGRGKPKDPGKSSPVGIPLRVCVGGCTGGASSRLCCTDGAGASLGYRGRVESIYCFGMIVGWGSHGLQHGDSRVGEGRSRLVGDSLNIPRARSSSSKLMRPLLSESKH